MLLVHIFLQWLADFMDGFDFLNLGLSISLIAWLIFSLTHPRRSVVEMIGGL
jgi:hypothetical protein